MNGNGRLGEANKTRRTLGEMMKVWPVIMPTIRELVAKTSGIDLQPQ